MINLLPLLSLLGSFFYFVKSLDFIYLFQTKEYRIDRFLALIEEEGIISLLFFRLPRLPAKSPRNFGLAFLSLLPSVFLLLLIQGTSSIFFLFMLGLAPFFSLISVILSIGITEIPVQIYRQLVVLLAKRKINRSSTIFIGVTGSYGKTSVKEFLYQILSSKYKTGKTDENQNTLVGVALSVLKNLKEDTDFFITEAGAYKKGEIKAICKLIRPKYAIMTGVGNQHLKLFGSKENLVAAKRELLESLPKEGRAYINKDSGEWNEIAKRIRTAIYFYSIKTTADIYVKHLTTSGKETEADVVAEGSHFHIKTHLLGKHTIRNLLPCIALTNHLGVDDDTIISAIKSLKPIIGRLSLHTGYRKSVIINDSYNSNLEGFLAAIEVVKTFEAKRTLILSRGIIELGEEKEDSYRRILEALHTTEIHLYTTDKLFKSLDATEKVSLFRDENALLRDVLERVGKNVLIVIEGKFPESFINTLIEK